MSGMGMTGKGYLGAKACTLWGIHGGKASERTDATRPLSIRSALAFFQFGYPIFLFGFISQSSHSSHLLEW